ncbi:uncharacterized protein L203_104758 [Cryptococcus depauperatus CBS 7841]|uniref:Uncharacterized protein n=1 Tax=Cryptococcus depauperatus CBS 7841 TaxID=1295531 RepID=A0A1E3INK9_9TREE|nr:hypothetical protein L203_02041 [Cryptococcus depauperatus CBS 7841]
MASPLDPPYPSWGDQEPPPSSRLNKYKIDAPRSPTSAIHYPCKETEYYRTLAPIRDTDLGSHVYPSGPSDTSGTQMESNTAPSFQRATDFLASHEYPRGIVTNDEFKFLDRDVASLNKPDKEKRKKLLAKLRKWKYDEKIRNEKNRQSAVVQLETSSRENDSGINTLDPNSEYNPDETMGSTREGADGGVHSTPVIHELLDTPPDPNNLDQPAGHTGYDNDDGPEQEDGNGGALGSTVVSPDRQPGPSCKDVSREANDRMREDLFHEMFGGLPSDTGHT